MLPSSVRRIVSSASQTAGLGAPKAATSAAVILSTARPSCHQRRCSSSKPSSPDKGPKDINARARQSVPASSGSSQADDAGAAPEKRKRREKNAAARDAAARKLPSVPSTQHLSQEALGLSTFFSMHRPISVTNCLPKSVSEEDFASIFMQKGKARQVSEVISTLSRTVDSLENPLAEMTIDNKPEADESGDMVQKVDIKHPDGNNSSIYLSARQISPHQFMPFRPPPLPVADQAAEDETASVTYELPADEEAEFPRRYQAVFMIEETTDPDGKVRTTVHSPQILQEHEQEPAPRSFLERLALRQHRFNARREETLQAISVRRIKKLKIKKKKYKKLLRRQRLERRKMDR